MHLAEARGGGGLPLELVEDLIHRPTQLTLDDRDDLIRGIRRGLILKRADRRQVGLGKDISARADMSWPSLMNVGPSLATRATNFSALRR